MKASRSDLILEARMAFDAGDIRRGSSILHEILQVDITYLPAWELLHAALDRSESLAEFQIDFARRYYPERAEELLAEAGPAPEKKSGTGPYRRVSLRSSAARVGERSTAEEAGEADRESPTRRAGAGVDPAEAGAEVVKKERKGLLARIRGFFARLGGRRGRKAGGRPVGETGEAAADPRPGGDAKFAPISLRDLPAKSTDTPPAGRDRKHRRPEARPLLTKLHEEQFEIRLLIADDIQQTRENIRKLLKFEPSVEVVGVAAHGEEAIELALKHQPDIVLMDINMPGMDGLQALKTIREKLPLTQVIMLTVQDDPGYLREALQFGARDYLIKPPTIDELLTTIQKTHEIGRQERERFSRMYTPPPEEDEPLPETEGLAVAIYSPKGGVGCTFLASNLAVAAQAEGRSVVLVDCDLQYGGVGLFFNEQARSSIIDLAPRVNDLDPNMFRDAVVTHQGSGVRLVLAPNRPEQAERVSGVQLVELIRYLRRRFGLVVVDTASSLDNRMSEVLAECDRVVVVMTQDIPAINEVRQLLDYASRIGLADGNISLVLNQYHSRINITPEQISRNLRREFAAVVPLDNRTAIPSINRGVPFMQSPESRSLPIGEAVRNLAARVVASGALAL